MVKFRQSIRSLIGEGNQSFRFVQVKINKGKHTGKKEPKSLL